jgi:hypothetical protein
LVTSLQQYLSTSLVTPVFASRFIEKCVELGAQNFNETTAVLFGNVTSSPDFTVVVVETSSPSILPTSPQSSGDSGGKGLPLPIWGFVLLGVGALALVLVLAVSYWRGVVRRSSELELAKTRYLETVSWKDGSPHSAAGALSSRADQSVLVGVDEVNLSYLPDPEFGDLSEQPGAVVEGGQMLGT